MLRPRLVNEDRTYLGTSEHGCQICEWRSGARKLTFPVPEAKCKIIYTN